MNNKIFTLTIAFAVGLCFTGKAQDAGIGVAWGTNGLGGSPLVLNEDFSGLPFYHTDENPGQGNSQHIFDGEKIIYGYKDTITEAAILGSETAKIKYTFYQCAFAPEWTVSAVPESGGTQTPNVSNGFVEISRFDTIFSQIPTLEGYFIVDLRDLEFVEGIQWSHSSTGGNKRGVLCEISFDGGTVWDTLRYQPGGSIFGYSFTNDFSAGDPVKTSNIFNCQPSANGMTWEDLILGSNVMLKFIDARPLAGLAGSIQTARIHDLKVYGDVGETTNSTTLENPGIEINAFNRNIYVSEKARVEVYNLSGNLVKIADQTTQVPMDDKPQGIYVVRAQTGKVVTTKQVFIP